MPIQRAFPGAGDKITHEVLHVSVRHGEALCLIHNPVPFLLAIGHQALVEVGGHHQELLRSIEEGLPELARYAEPSFWIKCMAILAEKHSYPTLSHFFPPIGQYTLTYFFVKQKDYEKIKIVGLEFTINR